MWAILNLLGVELQSTWLLHHLLQRMMCIRCVQVDCGNTQPQLLSCSST